MTLSRKEQKFIVAYFKAEKYQKTTGIKLCKAKIYREVFENPTLESVKATNASNVILKKYNKLPLGQQNEFLKNTLYVEEAEDLNKKLEDAKLVMAYNQGAEEREKRFALGFQEGVEAGKNEVKKLATSLSLRTEEDQINFIEGLASLFLADYQTLAKVSYFDKESNKYVSNAPVLSSIMSGLVNIAELNFKRFQKSDEFLKKMLDFKKKMEEEL